MEKTQYYKIVPSQNLFILGEYTQIDTIWGSYSEYDRTVIENLKPNESLPHEIKMPSLELYPKANFTDIIHSSIPGFEFLTLSEKAWDVFSELSLDAYQTFNVDIHRGNEWRKYIQLYIQRYRSEDFIDWRRSLLIYWQATGHVERGIAPIHSYDSYTTFLKEYYTSQESSNKKYSIRMKTLCLDEGKIDVDLFKINSPALGYYVSDKLKEDVLRTGLTGFEFESIEQLNRREASIQPWPGYENT